MLDGQDQGKLKLFLKRIKKNTYSNFNINLKKEIRDEFLDGDVTPNEIEQKKTVLFPKIMKKFKTRWTVCWITLFYPWHFLHKNISSRMVKALQSMYISVNSSEKLLSEEESNILYSFEAFNSVKQAHPSFSLLFFLFIIGIVQIICSGVGGLFTANDIKFFCSLCRRHR